MRNDECEMMNDRQTACAFHSSLIISHSSFLPLWLILSLNIHQVAWHADGLMFGGRAED